MSNRWKNPGLWLNRQPDARALAYNAMRRICPYCHEAVNITPAEVIDPVNEYGTDAPFDPRPRHEMPDSGHAADCPRPLRACARCGATEGEIHLEVEAVWGEW